MSGSARLSADTTRRGQDISAETARRGQDMSALTAEFDRRSREAVAQHQVRTGKPLTEFQAKAVGQLSRMEGAEQLLGEQFADYVPSLTAKGLATVPGLGNKLTTASFQGYEQAAREWISGVLRLDSGAAVPETEFARYFATYFPQPGDTAETVAQKATSRQRAMDALRGSLSDVGPDRLPARHDPQSTGGATGEWGAGDDALIGKYLGGA